MNTNSHPSPTNKRKEIIRFFVIMIPSIFVLLFTWLGLLIFVNKMGMEISAERVLLGVIALMIGGVWAWISLKGKMPFAQKGESLPYVLPTAKNPIEKLMRGLFLLVGIIALVAFSVMSETMVYGFFRFFFSYRRFFDTLGLLMLLVMALVIVIYHVIVIIKQRLLSHTNSKEENPYVSWYFNAIMVWIQFFALMIAVVLMVYKYMK